jgi:hypothetical protein
MPQLVVGHTTSDSAWIWVRGGPSVRRARVELLHDLDGTSAGAQEVALPAERDYIEVARFDSVLAPAATYRVLVHFDGPGCDPLCGKLRTFPKPGSERAFHFLHGSCNLPTARLTALGSFAAGMLGAAASRKSLGLPVEDWDTHHWPRWLPRSPWFRRALRPPVAWLAKYVPGAIAATTRYRLPKPLLPSPFADLAKAIVDPQLEERPAFMIHAGDQIYFDVDLHAQVDRDGYRSCYRQAWFEDESMAALLRSLPHYMILDDHEIVDSFGTDPDDVATEQKVVALDAYCEYVSCRQPSGSEHFFYEFEHGSTPFFVLDTRTERSPEREEMIGAGQLAAFERWLRRDPGQLKFVVSSVPFVAQPRPRPGDGDVEPSDKWSGAAWRRQRDRILAVIYAHSVERLVFLTGDMHCCYHATLRIGLPSRRLTVHELAGGPIHQLLFANRKDFYARRSSHFVDEAFRDVPWTSTLEVFHGAAPGVLRISVTPRTEERPLEVGWEVVRTRTRAEDRNVATARDEAAPLRGRIRFPRLRAEDP